MFIENILTVVPALVVIAVSAVLVYSAIRATRCLVARLQNNPCPN